MAFWGVEVKSSKPYSHQHDATRGRLHISQATLGIGSSEQRSLLQCNVGNKSPVYLCSLLPDKIESCPLNLEFEEEDEVIFSVLGPRSVHLSGFYIDKASRVHGDGDETDSYGEDIGETESEHSTFGTEDEYEDDFIDDDDIEMFSASPRRKSGVVIEEIMDDAEPVNWNRCSRRLKRRFQVSDSEDDNEKQIIIRGDSRIIESESSDLDALPNSSLLETKDESAEIREKTDTVSKEMEKAQGSDQVTGAETENEHVQTRMTDRGLGTTDDSTLPYSEAAQENVGKRKKKKKKDGTEEKTLEVVGDSIVVDHKEDKSQMEEAKADDITHGGSLTDEAHVKPSNEKGLGTTDNYTSLSFEAGQENVKKPKKKKKKEGTNEKKACEVADDCSFDVHKEDKSQIMEAKADDITHEAPIIDVHEKSSTDKVFEKTYDSTLSAPEVGQEKAEKSKRKKKKIVTTDEKTEKVLVGSDIVHREDTSQIVEAKSDSISMDVPVRDEADENPSVDKVVGKPNDSSPFYETGQENAKKPKKKKKKGVKTQSEETKEDDLVNVHEDKSQMEEAKAVYISQEVAPVVDEAEKKSPNDKGIEKPHVSLLPSSELLPETTEKPKKKKKKERTKEGKTGGFASNDMLDVQNEDTLQMEGAKVHDIIQDDPVSSKADENPSTDKFVEIDANCVGQGASGNKKHRKKNKKKMLDVDGKAIAEEAKEGLFVEIEDRKSKRKTARKSS